MEEEPKVIDLSSIPDIKLWSDEEERKPSKKKRLSKKDKLIEELSPDQIRLFKSLLMDVIPVSELLSLSSQGKELSESFNTYQRGMSNDIDQLRNILIEQESLLVQYRNLIRKMIDNKNRVL